MADEITFLDKDNSQPTSDPRRLIRAIDVNEIKDVVNANAAELEAIDSALDGVLASAPSNYNTFLEVADKLTSLDAAVALLVLKSSIVENESLSGTMNGVNLIFTISFTPNPTSSLKIYDAVRLVEGTDFTRSGTTITFVTPPTNRPIADYRK